MRPSYKTIWLFTAPAFAGGLAYGLVKLHPVFLPLVNGGLAGSIVLAGAAALQGAAMGLALSLRGERERAERKKLLIGGAAGFALGQFFGNGLFYLWFYDDISERLRLIFPLLPTFVPMLCGVLSGATQGLLAGLGLRWAVRNIASLQTGRFLAFCALAGVIAPQVGRVAFTTKTDWAPTCLDHGLTGYVFALMVLWKLVRIERLGDPERPRESKKGPIKHLFLFAGKTLGATAGALALFIFSAANPHLAIPGVHHTQNAWKSWLGAPPERADARGRATCVGCDPKRMVVLSLDARMLASQNFGLLAAAAPSEDGRFELKGLPVGKQQILIAWSPGVESRGKSIEPAQTAFYGGNPATLDKAGLENLELRALPYDLNAWLQKEWRPAGAGAGAVSGTIDVPGGAPGGVYVFVFANYSPNQQPWFGDIPLAAVKLSKPGKYVLDRLPLDRPLHFFAAESDRDVPVYENLADRMVPYSLNPAVLTANRPTHNAVDIVLTDPSKMTETANSTKSTAPSTIQFEDVTEASGVRFTHSSGERVLYMPEALGPGVCVFDYDDDGLEDFYIVNSVREKENPSGGDPTGKLFRNLGGMKFADATPNSGLDVKFQGIGCTTGDYDGDGRDDLYVSGQGRTHLFKNLGAGRFADKAREAGVTHEGLSVSSAFFDYDRDGDLDLYVTKYVDFDYRTNKVKPSVIPTDFNMGAGASVIVTLMPRSYPGSPNHLYQNDGRGAFEEVADQAGVSGIDGEPGKSLGVIAADLDRDGWPDVYVANDSTPNALHGNNRDGTFRERARTLGVNDIRGSMGVDVCDMDNDGLLDFVLTHFLNETNALYKQIGDERYKDLWIRDPVSAASLQDIAWGVGFADFDNDGWADLFFNNGHLAVPSDKSLNSRGKIPLIGQPSRALRNLGGGKFAAVDAGANPPGGKLYGGRGLARADFDGDGRVDVLLGNNNGPARILKNVSPNAGNWIALRLTGSNGNRNAYGARIVLKTGPLTLTRVLPGGSSYASKGSSLVHFGIGAAAFAQSVEIDWPSGQHQTLEKLKANKLYDVKEPGGFDALGTSNPAK